MLPPARADEMRSAAAAKCELAAAARQTAGVGLPSDPDERRPEGWGRLAHDADAFGSTR